MRLINKNNGKGKYTPAHKVKRKQCINKLGQLEDIEEELGIDLITLFKALKEGIYTIRSNGKKRYPFLTYNGAVGYIFDFMFEQEAEYILSDYGGTWSLTKKDVETTQKAIEYVNSWFK